MVEVPRLSSLAGELLRFFAFSSFILGILLAGVLMYFGKLSPHVAAGIGFAIAIFWMLFNILWTKGKIEELFGKLIYVIDIMEEREEKPVVPIPIHEEILGVVQSIKELVETFEERYKREITELQDQIDSISEKASGILVSLEKAQEGFIDVEFPSGLDPVGALGQSIQHTFDIYKEKLFRIQKNLTECGKVLENIISAIEKEDGKIDLNKLQEGIKELQRLHADISADINFFKESQGG